MRHKLSLNLLTTFGLLLLAAPTAYLIFQANPEIWYRLQPGLLESQLAALSDVRLNKEEVPPASIIESGVNTLRVRSIGVDTPILEDVDGSHALDKGVWRLPSYGNPTKNSEPIVLAAHRWGRLGLSEAYRRQHLFLNIPDLRQGQLIEIEWKGKKYSYEVELIDYSTSITRISDLILITCQYFNSAQRIVVYAKLVS